MEVIFWGGLLRFGEAVLVGAPTLLVGLFVAGVFSKLVGPELTFKIFGGRSWRSLPQAWFWGMMLPVCSIGVIPVAYELRRAGLRGGAILAFALTAPLFNPLSMLYGLTLSTPIVIMSFALGSLLVVTIVGMLWDWLFPNTEVVEPPPPPVPPGPKRLAAVALVAARHMAGPTVVYAAIGLAGTIVLAAIFPFGSLTDSMAHTDPWAPLQMLLVSLPAYATPLNIMMQVGGMFVHGNSVGAAYVLLSLGTGANLGLIAWAWLTYGFKKGLVFVVTFAAVVIIVAYVINDPLYSGGDVERAHTHAFDVYACPFSPSTQANLLESAWKKLSEGAKIYELAALTAVTCLFGVGLFLRIWDPNQQLERALEKPDPQKISEQPSWMNMTVPGPVLGITAILGLISMSVIGCYVYFPSPDQTLKDMRYVKADALSEANSKDVEKAVKNIERYNDLTRRLQVGYYLRTWELSEFQQAKAKLLRGRLEQLKDLLESKQFHRVGTAVMNVSKAHRRVADAFQYPR
ncbi:MAG: permease [Pirellulaceae bacterium]|nr:permease [Pirellulaceae bacterium]